VILTNAVYHHSCQIAEPVVIRIEKELYCIAGRNTGFPDTINALKENGSDLPTFEMNCSHSSM